MAKAYSARRLGMLKPPGSEGGNRHQAGRPPARGYDIGGGVQQRLAAGMTKNNETGMVEHFARSSEESSAPVVAPDSLGFWHRIQEHKILQWGLGYVGIAIAIAHGQELLADAFDWPHLIGRILMSVLVLGLPVVLTLAWYHGHKGLKRVGQGELTIIALLLLIGAGLLVVLVRSPGETSAEHRAGHALDSSVAPSTSAQAAAPVASPRGTSLAVLPFADMSPQHDQEY